MGIKRVAPFDEALLADAPGFVRKSDSQYITGRSSTIAPYPFESVYANGQIYTAATINSSHSTGITGVLERVTDNLAFGSVTTAIPVADKKVWKMICHPDHAVTFGRPRTQLVGHPLKPRNNYRIHLVFKLHQIDAMGWGNKNTDAPYGALFALSQQENGAGFLFSEGQYSYASSPLYIVIKGSSLYIELRTIAEECGLASTEWSSGTHTKWDEGDTIRTNRKMTPLVTMSGNGYHEIILDFNLDERRIKDGGKGYFKATFDGEPWLEYYGATTIPRNAEGNLLPCKPRLGFYEVNGAPQTEGTLNKNVTTTNTCTVERSLLIHHYSVTRL